MASSHAEKTCTRQKLAGKIDASSSQIFCTTLTGQPVTLHGSCHMPDSFCPVIELCSIACKKRIGLENKLVQDWPAYVQVACNRRHAQDSGTSLSSVTCRRHSLLRKALQCELSQKNKVIGVVRGPEGSEVRETGICYCLQIKDCWRSLSCHVRNKSGMSHKCYKTNIVLMNYNQ